MNITKINDTQYALGDGYVKIAASQYITHSGYTKINGEAKTIEGGANLPSEYKQVLYIQSNGTQCITPNGSSGRASYPVLFDFQCLSTGGACLQRFIRGTGGGYAHYYGIGVEIYNHSAYGAMPCIGWWPGDYDTTFRAFNSAGTWD